MSLRDVKIEKEYRNLSCNVIDDFYVPVLRESVLYKRAVGYFNSAALYEIATGLKNLVLNGGRIQLIVSPQLEDEDIEAIIKGYKTREEVVEKAIMNGFKDPINVFQQKKLNLLANLIAENKLDIKVAFKQNINSVGIFHEKIGIMEDIYGNKVAFAGSMNETFSGLIHNCESIDVFCSWLPEDSERVRLKEKGFDDLWNNTFAAMEVIEFPKVAIEKINRFKEETNYQILETYKLDKFEEEPQPKPQPDVFFRIPEITDSFKGLYDYQQRAIDTWMEKGSRGIFNMATGSGKTLTALGALSALSIKLKDKFVAVIICPQTHLVEQWVEDINFFGVKPIIAYSGYNWKEEFKKEVLYFNNGIKKHFCIITCNASYILPAFQEQLAKIRGDICLVVDEAHNFGAATQRQFMNDYIKYRLAVTATLDRHHDEEGTNALKDYFGDICIDYPLSRAIEEGKLCRYYYYPIVVTLEPDELDAYNKISEKISNIIKKMGGLQGREMPDSVKRLLIMRARIVSGARNKIKKLYELMQDYKDDNNILVYCGATKIPNDDYIGDFDYCYDDDTVYDGKSKRQIDVVTEMIGKRLKMKVHRFTADENPKEREQIKRDFAEGKMLQTVVAIKCLDEGLNIPGIKTAFILASSTNPKEYIQRRGRVLRRSPNKQYAYIYDFITLPHDLDDGYVNDKTAQYELSLIKKEKIRMEDFQALAENSLEVDKVKCKIDSLYNLDIIGGYEDEF